MKKRTKNLIVKKNIKRLLVFGFFSFAIIFAVLISVFNVVNQIVDKYKEAEALELQMALLSSKEEDLNQEIRKLQDSDYLARYAREKYFYSKTGELIIRIPTEN